MEVFNLTPDPKILIALTHTPMQPLDALCELIDNAIDSFHMASLQGAPVTSPIVVVDLPKKAQIAQGEGYVRIRDNGSGLTFEMAEKALRAGFSGNNPYDTLGLFGMGFNISTGKLGRVTRFLTARAEDDKAIEVIVDLEKINRDKSYDVPVQRVDKPQNFTQGTLIDISRWWPDGNPNKGFISKLIQYGSPKIREELGRRYTAILREKKIQILVNGDPVVPFEHCVWDDTRFVERKGIGKISAVIRFDELVGTQKRCTACTALVDKDLSSCQVCGSHGMRTIEERIRGWVGIQRFDHNTEYGIDLIRNGRSIRIAEKSAFFEFTDEFKRVIKDYPIDSIYGRIVGEVHLNHVPVDFLKQDFQRNTNEWQKAMSYLRGDSSLQPTQPGADENTSPVFKLYQGYRRVRTFGKADMYMGYWDEASGGPKRIAREKEEEYYCKFKERIPGFYDDSEWWKLVEQADNKPLDELVECPKCFAQNLGGHDICQACGHVLRGKTCLNPECKATIPLTAASCPICGTSQVPEIKVPWICDICECTNKSEATTCQQCGAVRGELSPLSREFLFQHADKSDELSFEACTIKLADGKQSAPLKVQTYITHKSILPPNKSCCIPLITVKNPDVMEIFIDLSHRLFKSFNICPEQMIAAEIAIFIFDSNRSLVKYGGTHSVANLQSAILESRWASKLEMESSKVKDDIRDFFASLREQLPAILSGLGPEIYDTLQHNDEALKRLVDNLMRQHKDLTQLSKMSETGEYLAFLDETTVVDLFKDYSDRFFDNAFWSEPYNQLPDLPSHITIDIRKRTRATYLNCLEDACNFLNQQDPERNITIRAQASLVFLQSKAV